MRRSTAVTLSLAMAAGGVVAVAAPGFGATAPQRDPVGLAQQVIAAHPTTFEKASGDVFVERNMSKDPDGATHVHLNRVHDGLPVLGGDVIVHTTAGGSFAGASVVQSTPLTLSTTPTLTSAQAKQKSQKAFAGKRSSTDKPRLVVDALDPTVAPSLVWETVVHGVRADQTPSRLHVLVDAASGKVVNTFDEINTGTGHGLYVGTVTIGTSSGSGGYQMRDNTRGGGYTTDLRGAQSGTGTVYTSSNDVFGNGSTSDRASAGVDAHYGAQETYDYFKNEQGRNGIFGDGRGVPSRTHYGNAYVNAFWDGQQMTYGDGRGNANPLTELDVAGHEMTHGVTERTAGLAYTGESGGLNEATSDIFGTMVEFEANLAADPPDYTMGEQININGDGRPLRYMYKPSLDGRSYDCWSSGVGNSDVHFSSGVGNHFFFLAAQGSGNTQYGNSPTCDGSTVTGIGRDAAAKIYFRALSTYMTSNTNYRAARAATLSAATDLYGKCSTQYRGIQAAWSGVAVTGSDPACTGNPTPTNTGTPTPTNTGTPTPPGGCAAAWDPNEIYLNGDQVSHEGELYQAQWWTQGDEPGTTGQWGVWKDLGPCSGQTPTPTGTSTPTSTGNPTPTSTTTTGPGQYPAWTQGTTYAAGDKVSYNGKNYQCVQGHTAYAGWTPDVVPALWNQI